MRPKRYFTPDEKDFLPITCTVKRKIRFEEVDLGGIVWHGRYASFFEDARVELTNRCGIGYMDFINRGYGVPVVRMETDYIMPLRFDEMITIEATMHYTLAAKMNISYVLKNEQGDITTTGCTVQLIVTLAGELCMAMPDFYAEFCDKWQQWV